MTTNIEIASDLNVAGTSNLSGAVTANTIQPTANDTGSIGTSSLNYSTAYINKAYLGFIETLVYMQNGASFYGPLNILDPSGNSIFSITVNSSNQLQIASSGETNPILVSDTSNNVNFPGNLSVTGTSNLSGAVTASEIQVNPTGGNPQGITINGSSTTGDGTQIFFQESGTTYWQMGPNYETTGGGGGPHDFWLLNNTTGTNILQFQSASNTVNIGVDADSSYPVTLNVGGTINPNASQTTITGTTTGSIVCSMPFQGSSYKKVIIYCNGYSNDTTTAQTYTFPTAFTLTPIALVNEVSAMTITVSTTGISFVPDNTTIYSGYIILEGY